MEYVRAFQFLDFFNLGVFTVSKCTTIVGEYRNGVVHGKSTCYSSSGGAW